MVFGNMIPARGVTSRPVSHVRECGDVENNKKLAGHGEWVATDDDDGELNCSQPGDLGDARRMTVIPNENRVCRLQITVRLRLHARVRVRLISPSDSAQPVAIKERKTEREGFRRGPRDLPLLA